MTTVRVLPAEIEFEVAEGQTVMGAAQANGLYWPTTCGGQGICTTCLSEVVSGAQSLTEMGRYERRVLQAERGPAILNRPMRLACQATCKGTGTVELRKNGVRAAGEL
jgi:2Fe-2S ferredoxin